MAFMEDLRGPSELQLQPRKHRIHIRPDRRQKILFAEQSSLLYNCCSSTLLKHPLPDLGSNLLRR
jgi:hypothetical protein